MSDRCRKGHDLTLPGARLEAKPYHRRVCRECRRAAHRRHDARHRETRAQINARYRAKMPLVSVGLSRAEFETFARIVGDTNVRKVMRRLVQEFNRKNREDVA